MGEIADAVHRYTDRKKAAGVAPEGSKMPEGAARLIISGFDLDYDELLECQIDVVKVAFAAALSHPLPEVFFGQWIDGLVTGLVMGQIRREKEMAIRVEEAVIGDAAIHALYSHLPNLTTDSDSGPNPEEEQALKVALEAVAEAIAVSKAGES
jgi:hypothetical protein